MAKKVTLHSDTSNNLLLALQQAQRESGYLSPALMVEIARSLRLPVNAVYGVASFYSFLNMRPPGRNVIRICRSVPCYLKENRVIIETVEREIGIRPGETSADGRFSFELTNCIGLCDRAPAMLVNSDAHGDLTPSRIVQVLQSYE
ncbi:MAG: NAD(P)H-dependent oxidoreductase subunit E [Dehalococcoidia bacterium]|nr:NAD(P)H-dependent oxidoreductase subunit E [Dehalococcoidia bacterium]